MPQTEEPPENHGSVPMCRKGHLLVCVWELGVGSKSHLYPSKHHRHFQGTGHGIEDTFCLLGVSLCMCLQHMGHSGVKATLFDFKALCSQCIYSSQCITWGPYVSPLVMRRHAFQSCSKKVQATIHLPRREAPPGSLRKAKAQGVEYQGCVLKEPSSWLQASGSCLFPQISCVV